MENEPECRWCERGLALVGVLAGVAILYIAADTLAGGALTRLLSRTGGAVADVVPIGGAADDAA